MAQYYCWKLLGWGGEETAPSSFPPAPTALEELKKKEVESLTYFSQIMGYCYEKA